MRVMIIMRMRIIKKIMINLRMMTISLMIILPGGRNCSEERQKGGSQVRNDFDQDDDFDAD